MATGALLLAVAERSVLWLAVMASCDLIASLSAASARMVGVREKLVVSDTAVQYTRGNSVMTVPMKDIVKVDYFVDPERAGTPAWLGVARGQLRFSGSGDQLLLVVPVNLPVPSVLHIIRCLRQTAWHITVGSGVLHLMAAELQP